MVCRDKTGILRLDGTLTDITPRKQAEQELKQKEDRCQAFMDNSPAVAFMKDPDGRCLYYNRPFQKLFLRGNDDLIGKTDADLFPLEIVRKLRENDGVLISSGRSIETVETVPTPDGVLRDWLVFMFPLPEPSGRVLLGGVAVDITDRRRLERK